MGLFHKEPPVTNETAVIIAALGGAAIGGAITLATNWINKRSEERKQLNSLFVNAGIMVNMVL